MHRHRVLRLALALAFAASLTLPLSPEPTKIKDPYVVIDNEAGMEHLSRRTTHKVNLLLIVSDPTMKGILTAKRINELVDELQLEVHTRALIINRVLGEEGRSLATLAESFGVRFGGLVPQDGMIAKYDLEGKAVYRLPDDAVSVLALSSILDSFGIP